MKGDFKSSLGDLREKFQDSVVAKGFLCSTSCFNRDCYLGTVSCNVFSIK